jgi:glycosyltransferase involved in cell wall biosynthesis
VRDTAPVSVVVATRNSAAYVAAALDSIVTQIPRPAEIIVIEGNSTDDTVEVVARFPGVRVIRQVGGGLAAARNEAIRACSQPLIAFCDSDDRWTAGALAARLDALSANPEVPAVIGLVVRVAIEGSVATAAQHARIGRAVPGFVLSAMLVRREAFEQVGWFDESLPLGPELDWIARLQQSGSPVLQLDTVVVHKGARGTSLSTNVSALRDDLLTVARRIIDRQRGKPSLGQG